jgi:hypothetical protein
MTGKEYRHLVEVATQLYYSGYWVRPGYSEEDDAPYWERLRDALLLAPGSATKKNVGKI